MRTSALAFVLCTLAALLLTLPTWPGALVAAGNGDGNGGAPRDPLYTEARELIGRERYADAVPLLEQLVAKDPRDADAYNLLGYSTRKLGRPQEALGYYHLALAIKPDHRGAHEYIGEAYLMLGQLDKAKEHLAFLDKDCWLPCQEYSDLKSAVAHYEATHPR